MPNQHLQNILQNLPDSAGVYQFFNKEETIIYVGKAKNLKKRVLSYFNKNHDSPKTAVLVRNIADIKYIVVESESDALLLENNLIKKNQPRYNVMLKDGKTYPWLCITKEDFPRVFKTRRTFPNAEFFGPYSIIHSLDVLLELIGELYQIRSCKFPLTEENIAKKKYKKVCLEYHIKNCKGVCCGLQSRESYNQMINEIKTIAKGHSNLIADFLLNQMHILSAEMKFEKAQELKKKYEAILKYQTKTVITTINDDDIDVFAYDKDEPNFYINMLKIVQGAVVQSFTIEYKKQIEESDADVFSMGIMELRNRFLSKSKKIIVPFVPDFEINGVEFIVPKIKDKKKLLELSQKNVRQYKLDRLIQQEKLNSSQKNIAMLKEIQELLHLSKMPRFIEIFDNSNIAGSDAVAACVAYKDLKPSKADYRKFIIKTADTQDDYGSMMEVVHRHYLRLVTENLPLPDLIIADGGKGQMEAIRKVVEDELNLNIPIVGLAKNEKHRTKEILIGFPSMVVGLKPTSGIFKFFTKMQDEVHRFAITFHRDKRSKNQTKSELDEVKGIGEKAKSALLTYFKSIKRLKTADFIEIEKVVGTKKAELIRDYFLKIVKNS
ncbi:MAG: excinuclease ABC subunit UvrC [Prevotellaceae bacterium]|jgi:excinuclease ABC subunit C|nr:excinuclease ABC subunit UvrC [Prevotellaceae bacterium]